ncbi:hypothetical protein ACIOGZ_08165 [Kitasatospora sp. NPDC088160]|uniref:hypothetical protein n=1 Tax=Kitasatospora sp. NPDC088160 TaxID=3364072 RepID=UPI0038143591
MTSTRTSDVEDEAMAEYALGLDDAYRSWPSWCTSLSRRSEAPTHVELFSYTEYPLSITDASNYRVAAKLIRDAADKGRDDTAASDGHVVEVSGSAMHYGSATVLYVQVYEGGCEIDCPGAHTDECRPNCDPCLDFCFGDACEGDCHGTRRYTPAFRDAVSLAEGVKHGYPLLDEEDYGELEDEVFQENLQFALDDVRREFDLDEEHDHEAIVERAHDGLRDLKYEAWSAGDVSTRRVAEVYAMHRDAYFDGLARDFLRGAIHGQIELVAV